MHWLDLALPLVKRWEGLKLTAYLCPAGVLTIGYGHTGSDVQPGEVWTQQQADDALRRELAGFGERVDALVIVPLEPHEMAALASFAYNVGMGAFRKSTMLRLLNRGAKPLAAREFGRWNRAGGRILRGLTNRRAAERALFLGTS